MLENKNKLENTEQEIDVEWQELVLMAIRDGMKKEDFQDTPITFNLKIGERVMKKVKNEAPFLVNEGYCNF